MPRSVRRAQNQQLFRKVNEAISHLPFEDSDEPRGFVCECDQLGCSEPIELAPGAYARIRDDPSLFVVRRGHENPEAEIVVSDHDYYLIVKAAD